MKPILVALIATVPMLAQAQERIPETVLAVSYARCMPGCEAERSHAFCAAACSCMVDEMRRHWTMDDLEARGDRLEDDPADHRVRIEMERLAAHCANRTAGTD